MSSSSEVEPDVVSVEKVIASITGRGYSVLNVTDDGIILVSSDTLRFRNVIIVPAGKGDMIPTSVVRENIRSSNLSWGDILPELI